MATTTTNNSMAMKTNLRHMAALSMEICNTMAMGLNIEINAKYRYGDGADATDEEEYNHG